jgi:hypothetical protein
MKIAPALAKIPWKFVFRYLPGIIGIAGGLTSQRVEQGQAENLKRIEGRQHDLERGVETLSSRLKVLLWIATAALIFAVVALVIALAR